MNAENDNTGTVQKNPEFSYPYPSVKGVLIIHPQVPSVRQSVGRPIIQAGQVRGQTAFKKGVGS